uniref:Cuticle protein n=1 Tax=Rhipicephalus appendiculatus TaxID=34631 RepID=A0A131YDS2_RHIAP
MRSLIIVLTVLAACCAVSVRAGAVAPLVAAAPLAAAPVAAAPVFAAPAPVLAAPTAVSYQYSHKVHHPVVAAYPYVAPLPYVAGR